jgi:hypothetical protein
MEENKILPTDHFSHEHTPQLIIIIIQSGSGQKQKVELKCKNSEGGERMEGAEPHRSETKCCSLFLPLLSPSHPLLLSPTMQTMQRQFGRMTTKRSADDSQVAVLLKDIKDADQLLTQVRWSLNH